MNGRDIIRGPVREMVLAHRNIKPTPCPECGAIAASFVCAICKTVKPNAPSWLKQVAAAESKL